MTGAERGRRKILLVNMAGLGDIIMMTPAVRAIRAAFPEASLELLTIDRSKELAAGIQGIDKIHSVPIRYRFAGPATVYKFIRTLLELRRENFSALVNFSLVSSFGGLLKARLINAVVKPGLSSCRVLRGLGAAGNFTAYEEFVEKQSETTLTARLLAPLGVEARDLYISYSPGPEEKKRVSLDLAARGVSGKPVIGLNPGAFRPSRRWPAEKWKSLIGLLLEKYPRALIVVTGSGAEKNIAEELTSSGRIFPAAGLYSIRENAALFGLMDVFISNDTGPMHIAAAVGVRTVCLFGPGDHWRFAPAVPVDQKRIVRRDIPECNIPCYKFNCRNPLCLEGITPEEVMAAVIDILESGGEQPITPKSKF